MADGPLESVGFLPTIKCSSCGLAVEIMAMGEHICGQQSSTPSQCQESPPPPPSPTTKPQSLSASKALRLAKMKPLPPIDASAANRPFLQPGSPTRYSSNNSTPRAVSPFSAPLASRGPQTSRSPYFAHQPASSNDLTNPSQSVVGQAWENIRSPNGTPPATQQPQPLELKSQSFSDPSLSDTFHRRNFSIDSKSSYRTSRSSKFSSAASNQRPSVGSIFRAFRVSDDAPPMPPPPAMALNGNLSSLHDRTASTGIMKSNGSEEDDNTVSSSAPANIQYRPSNPPTVWRRETVPRNEYEDKDAHENFPNAGVDDNDNHDDDEGQEEEEEEETLSLSNFARSLGVEFDSSTESSSSESSQSEAHSGSSMSSLPSEGSWTRGKPSQRGLLDSVTEEPQLKNGGFLLHESARSESPTILEPPPTIPAYLASPDSPTDPAIVQGTVSLIPEDKDLPAEPRSPAVRPHMPRSPTAPSPRPRPKGRCKGCREFIMGKSVSSADGRLTGRYHRGCFVCYHCQAPFKTADFYVLDDRPYCKQHYHQLNGSLCSSCNHGIEGQYLETLERSGRGAADRQKFHPECLRCCKCRVSLKGDYFEWNGQVYCDRDARKAAAAMPPRGYRRPAMAPSPLPSHPEIPDHPGQYRWDHGHYHAPSTSRRYPERRTTRLMMI